MSTPRPVLDLIIESMQTIGALATRETPTADEASDALSLLNAMLETWSVEKLGPYAAIQQSFSLIDGKIEYTIGPGGELSGVRPIDIQSAVVRLNGVDYPVKVTTDAAVYDAITVKALGTGIPMMLYYNADWPLGSVRLWPSPQAGCQLLITHEEQLARFASTSATFAFPPGYWRAMRYNLALELAPEFGLTPRADVVAIAASSLASIKRANKRMPELRTDAAWSAAPQGFGAFVSGGL